MITGEFETTLEATTDLAYVRVPSFDGGRSRTGPVVWAPHVDDSGFPAYPQARDIAFLDESDLGEWVVLAWRPRTAEDDS